jgi:hypothetical protein
MSAAIPDVTTRRAPSSADHGLFALLWNNFPCIEKECSARLTFASPNGLLTGQEPLATARGTHAIMARSDPALPMIAGNPS